MLDVSVGRIENICVWKTFANTYFGFTVFIYLHMLLLTLLLIRQQYNTKQYSQSTSEELSDFGRFKYGTQGSLV